MQTSLRCAICHGPVEGDLFACSCGSIAHLDCLRDHGRCPTLGCPGKKAPEKHPEENAFRRPGGCFADRTFPFPPASKEDLVAAGIVAPDHPPPLVAGSPDITHGERRDRRNLHLIAASMLVSGVLCLINQAGTWARASIPSYPPAPKQVYATTVADVATDCVPHVLRSRGRLASFAISNEGASACMVSLYGVDRPGGWRNVYLLPGDSFTMDTSDLPNDVKSVPFVVSPPNSRVDAKATFLEEK